MSKWLRAVVLTGIVATALVGRGEARTEYESLGCGMDQCVTIWTFKCEAARTKYAAARVCPAFPGSEAFFNVTIVGKTPASLLGKGDIDQGGYEACTDVVYLARPTTGPMSGYVTVSRWNDNGTGGQYNLTVWCLDTALNSTTEPTLNAPTRE